MTKLKRLQTAPAAFMQRCARGLFTPVAIGCTVILTIVCNPAHAQIVTTIAGSGSAGYAGDNGPATAPAARLFGPRGVLARADGSVLIVETTNNLVRKVDVGGIITTFAGGTMGGYSGDGSPATGAKMDRPISIAEDANGNVYIGTVGAIRKVTPAGIISTFAGTGSAGFTGENGQATLARIGWVRGMCIDSTGNLFFTDSDNNHVRRITASGVINVVAGTSVAGVFGADNISALAEPLGTPEGIMVAADGNLLVSVAGHNRVRKIVPGGNITTVAGGGANNSDNVPATTALLSSPNGLAPDGAGGFFVTTGNRVRKIAADGTITTIIGNAIVSNTGDGGLATAATINSPIGLSRSSTGNLFISSNFGHTVRKITFTPPVVTPGPSVFNAYLNTTTATLGTITPAGEQTVPFGGVVNLTVTANPRHVLRVSSNCDYAQTNKPVAFVPIGTGANTYAVTVNGPCQLEATFRPLIPRTNVASEAAANTLFMATERAQTYVAPTTISQTTSAIGQNITFKAWVTDIAGVPYPSATNVITFKANGTAITGCSNVPLTLRASSVIHIREALCVTSFAIAGNTVITSEFAGDTYNFPAASSGLNHSVSVAP